MNRKQFFACHVLLWIGAASVCADVTLTQPSSQVIASSWNPCPQHADHRCSVRLHPEPARLISNGGSDWFINSPMPNDFPNWTMQSGIPLTGEFEITKYDAYNDCNPGGAEFRMSYIPGIGDPSPLTWSQGIFTNHRRGGAAGTYSSYMDVLHDASAATAEPPAYPYQYADGHFYDKPGRPCPGGGYIVWIAEVYATALDYAAQNLIIYDGVEWGFTYTCYPRTPLRPADSRPTVTHGSRDAVYHYDPAAQQLSISGPINIINLTGGDELSPLFSHDRLNNAWFSIEGLRYTGRDDVGAHVFENGRYVVATNDGQPLMQAEIRFLMIDDTMRDDTGFNVVGLYGDIQVLPSASQPMQMYQMSLNADSIPQLIMDTDGPLSQLLDESTDANIDGIATIKHGFNINEEPWYPLGDFNGDGLVDNFDIDAFVTALTDPETYALNFPEVPLDEVSDINGDGEFNNFDIDAFVALLTGG